MLEITRTECLEHLAVERLSVSWRLVNLPVPGVHDGAVVGAQDQATAVRDGVGHTHWLDPVGTQRSVIKGFRVS